MVIMISTSILSHESYITRLRLKLCSNSTMSRPSQVPRMFMSFKPILSNSFIKCWLMSFVFSSNRPVSAYSFRPFISIPINSICFRNLEIIALDLSVPFIFWLLSYLLQLLSLSNNNDQLQVNPFVTRLIKQLPFLYWFNSWYHIKSLLIQVWVVECSITLILYKTWTKIKFVYITMASVLAQWQDQYSERNMLAPGITDIRDNMAVTRLSLTGTFLSTSHTWNSC